MSVHSYSACIAWSGSTQAGYREYSRDHTGLAPPAESELRLSADRAFRGSPELMNPEQLLVLAASSCQLLSFLALAARAGIDILRYEDQATGTMDDGDPPIRIGSLSLRPVITVTAGTDREAVQRLVTDAHDQCYIANTLRAAVEIEATVVVDGPGAVSA